MRGLDTNVLLRPLVQDEPLQTDLVETLFQETEEAGERLFVSGIVLCETCWALRGYGYSRPEIAGAIEKLLSIPLFEIQDRELVRRAVLQYRQGRADFADYLIGWLNRQAGCEDTVSFDKQLAGTPGFEILTVEGATSSPSSH